MSAEADGQFPLPALLEFEESRPDQVDRFLIPQIHLDNPPFALEQWWFPIDLPSVRTDALVHSPTAFRIRGIFIGTGALDRA